MKLEEGFFGKLEMWTIDGSLEVTGRPKGASVMNGNTYYTQYRGYIMRRILCRSTEEGVMVVR